MGPVALVLWLCPQARAQAPPTAGAEPPRSPTSLDRAWVDALFGQATAEGRVSAATVALTDTEGRTVTAGYGSADLQSGRRVEPERTRFLIASVTKTFTATAVVQMLERGEIASLDRPVNDYLRRVQVRDAPNGPITIRDLLTHRNGLDVHGYGMVIDRPMRVPLGATEIDRALPPVVRRRGKDVVYSNAGFALLGVMAEDVTSKTMQVLLRERVLEPLGMSSTELSYLPGPEPELARAFDLPKAGPPRAVPFLANAPFYAPVGSIRTTAADMARYITAQLRAARGEANPVLGPGHSRALTTRTASNGPGLGGVGLSYMLNTWNEEPIAEHAGGFSGFASQFVLVPSRGVGMFAAWAGSPVGGHTRPIGYDEVRTAFLASLLGPYRTVVAPASPTAGALAARELEGTYWRENRSHSGLEVLLSLDTVWTVTSQPDGGLTIEGEGPYVQTQAGVFVRQPGPGRPPRVFSFSREDETWRMASLADVGWKRTGLRNPRTLKAIMAAAFACGLTGVLAVLWPGRSRSRWAANAKWLALVLGLSLLGALGVATLGYAPGESIVTELLRGRATRFVVLAACTHLLPLWVVGLAGATLAVVAGHAWPPGWRARLASVHLVVLLVATAALTWALWSLDVFGHVA